MTQDNGMIGFIATLCSVLVFVIEAICNWSKIRPVIFSHAAFVTVEYSMIFACFRFGPLAILAGANIFILLVFVDFTRRNDTSCGSIGYAILTTALGVFCFAAQFAIAINAK